MNPSEGLRDIQGLDPSSWWPPAPGWWLVVVLAALAAFLLARALRRWLRQRSWRAEAAELLRDLRRRVLSDDARALAGELSELLRRVAMARFGRRSCAGLVGTEWLAWLERHDPRGFAWTSEGRALVELPYAPSSARIEPSALRPLLRATAGWLRRETRPRSPRVRRTGWAGRRRAGV